MIETITLRNYKGHAETTISCDRLTVLLGENASGKTSVLEGVQVVSKAAGSSMPGGFLRRGARQLEIVLSCRTAIGQTEFSAIHEANLGPEGLPTDDILRPQAGSVPLLDLDDTEHFRPLVKWLSLNPEALAAASKPTSVKPELASTGRGLASVLAYLKLAETVRFRRVVERLRGVVPVLRDIGFSRVEVKESSLRQLRVEDRVIEIPEAVTSIQDVLTFDFADAERVPAAFVSEGTLLVLGVLTALEILDRETGNGANKQVSRPEVILIDDIDRALHPRAQRALIKTLREILDVTPELQILTTAHSPYLVDELRPSEVVVLGRNAAGIIAAKRLGDFPDQRLKSMLDTGDIWISEGDQWVAR